MSQRLVFANIWFIYIFVPFHDFGVVDKKNNAIDSAIAKPNDMSYFIASFACVEGLTMPQSIV